VPPRRRSPRAAAAAAPPQGPPAPPPGRGGPSRPPRRRHRRNHQLRLPAAPGLPLPGRRRQCLAPRWPPLPGPAVRSCGWRGRASPPPPGGRRGPPAQRGPRHRTALHRSEGPGTLSRYCIQVWEGLPGVWGALWVSKTVGALSGFVRGWPACLREAATRPPRQPEAALAGGSGNAAAPRPPRFSEPEGAPCGPARSMKEEAGALYTTDIVLNSSKMRS
jgi:hypothetical protein